MKKAALLTAAVRDGYSNQPPKLWPIFNSDENMDRLQYISASSISKCARQLWYDRNVPTEVTAPDLESPYMGMAERGHTAEAWVVEQFRRAGIRIMFMGDEQRSFIRGLMSGTPDGVIINDDDTLSVIDIKSFHPNKRMTALPDPKHIEQVQVNCFLVEENLGKPVTSGRLLYINAADYNHMVEFEFDPPTHEAVEEWREYVATIMGSYTAEALTPGGLYSGGCRFCAHTDRCSAALIAETEEKKRMLDMKATSGGMFK